MRKPFIAGNWKMHNNREESVNLVNALKTGLSGFDKVDVAVCPPFTYLSDVAGILEKEVIDLGAQDMFYELQGAFTGEVSGNMLKDCGCKYVIIGHSERRKHFFDTDELINKKLKAALTSGLIPILCVGEVLEEREEGKTLEVIGCQLQGGLSGFSGQDILNLVIAYEPVWAIGTGRTATPDQAEQVHSFIRNWIKDKYGADCAETLRILYGGSVKPGNISALMAEKDIDGALVGGASLKAESFIDIVKGSLV